MGLSLERQKKLLEIEKALTNHAFPPQIILETTSYCNMKCTHCSHVELKRPNAHMDENLFKKIVDEIGQKSPNTEIWPTFYGEALILGDKLFELLDYADNAGCKNLVLNSNGRLLGRNGNIDKILNSPLKRFILSLDGFTKETFESIRVGGKRDEIYANVKKLIKRKEELGKKYPAITCQFSKMEENEAEVDEFYKYWVEVGAEVKIRPKLEWTRTGSITASNIDSKADFRIACPWGNNTMAIHQNGNVVTCAVDYEGMYIAGNLNNSSIEELWKVLYKDVRTPHINHSWSEMPNICQGCFDWQVAGADYMEETIEGTRPFWFKGDEK